MATPKSIVASDVIGVIGDSISSGLGVAAGWMFNFMPSVKAQQFAPPVVNPLRQPVGYQAQKFPSFLIDATLGRKVGDISGTMATVLAPFIAARTSIYVVQLGTNDCGVTAAATFIPQVVAVRNAITAAAFFKMLIWIGPWCNGGENWPDGVNPVDTTVDGIADKDSQIPAQLSGTPNTFYISWRQLRLNTMNASVNPGHLSSGIYTSDGTHPTSSPSNPRILSGDNLLSNWVIPLLTYA